MLMPWEKNRWIRAAQPLVKALNDAGMLADPTDITLDAEYWDGAQTPSE